MKIIFLAATLSFIGCWKKQSPAISSNENCQEVKCEIDSKGPFNCVCKD